MLQTFIAGRLKVAWKGGVPCIQGTPLIFAVLNGLSCWNPERPEASPFRVSDISIRRVPIPEIQAKAPMAKEN
jgi:hypothetical protein